MTRLTLLLLLACSPALAQVTIPAPPDFAALARDGAQITVGPGNYWLGEDNIRAGKNVTLRGDGRDTTVLNHSGYKTSAQGCFIEGNVGLRIEDITLRAATIQGQQNQVVGFQGVYPIGGVTLPFQVADDADITLIRCWLRGRTFAGYLWGGKRNRMTAFRCDAEAGTWVWCAAGGSGPDAQFLRLVDCNSWGDWERLRGAGGDQDGKAGVCAGVVVRGGQCQVIGGTITIKGNPKCGLAVGVLSSGIPHPPEAWPPNSTWPKTELVGVTFNVQANGSPEVWDIVQEVGIVVATDCKRSDGQPLKIKGKVVIR